MALAILFVAQLVWYLVYTRQIVQALRANQEGLSQVYAQVLEGNDGTRNRNRAQHGPG